MQYSPETQAILDAIRRTRNDTDARLDKLTEEVAAIRSGFPDGDPDSHRRYHESIIEWRELRNKMVREALTHAAKVGFWAAGAWILYAIWLAIKLSFLDGEP